MEDEILPHGKLGWLKVAAGACESSDCWTGDFKASVPSLLGVTGEKADGRGRDLASLLSLFSLSFIVFDFVTLWLSLPTGLSHPTSSSSVSSLLSSLFSLSPCFSGLLLSTSGKGLGQSGDVTRAPFAGALNCRAICPFFCDTREIEFLHRLYFMWLKRWDFSLQVKGHWKHWYLKGFPGGRGM